MQSGVRGVPVRFAMVSTLHRELAIAIRGLDGAAVRDPPARRANEERVQWEPTAEGLLAVRTADLQRRDGGEDRRGNGSSGFEDRTVRGGSSVRRRWSWQRND